jgi:hypothetical protein
MLGAADNGHQGETGFAVGAEYRYARNERFAIGSTLDCTTSVYGIALGLGFQEV